MMASGIVKRHCGNSKEEKIFPSKETKDFINEELISFMQDEERKELSFPSSFTNVDRKLAHKLAAGLGMKSKSDGNEPNRIITVYKVQTVTNRASNRSQDYLTLNVISLHKIEHLKSQYPIRYEGMDLPLLASETPVSIRSNQLAQATALLPKTDIKRTRRFRESLPIHHYTEEIMKALRNGRVTLIIGETGCGKTTQIPQMIMEFSESQGQKCNIVCSMPRRVAVVTMSERVAFERGERLGETVGYQIRLESRTSSKTILTYCTNGVLLQCLLNNDKCLNNISHIIIDEIHERDKLTDFTLIILRDALAVYPHLKLVLMSATIYKEKFENYFQDFPSPGECCNVVEVPGRNFDVQEVYLEHILEGSNYMSPEMNMEQKVYPVCRSAEGTSVESLAEKIAKIDLHVKEEVDSLLFEVLHSGTSDTFNRLFTFMSQHYIPVDYQHSDCGRTALMAAAIHSDLDAVDHLVQMEPDLSIKSKEGKTALVYAEEAADKDILEWLDAYKESCDKKEVSAAASADIESSSLSHSTQDLIRVYEKCHLKKDVDENLILHVLKIINDDGREGAVLVFLPGIEQIMRVRDRITENVSDFKSTPLQVHLLHSRMKSVEQKKAFQPAPKGHRKVILSTNISETSVTINDVRFVVDCGKVKQRRYDINCGSFFLDCDWISQSCAQQRKGRAGRTSNGVCFRLYSKKRFLSLEPHTAPEILRESLTELCLQARQLAPKNLSIEEFLSKAVDPPLPDVTQTTVHLLKQMDALSGQNEDLTKLGRFLLQLPLDPKYGKMVVISIILKCLDPVLTIVCCLSNGDLFKMPVDPLVKARIIQRRIQLSQGSFSDHMVYLNAFREWEEAASKRTEWRWCQENFINGQFMEMVAATKRQILGLLRLHSDYVNVYSENWTVIKAALTAGSYPNVARVEPGRNFLRTRNELKVVISTSSVLKQSMADLTTKKDQYSWPSLPWVIYDESNHTGAFNSLCTCTVVSPLTVWMFAGPAVNPSPKELEPDIEDESDSLNLQIDEFINFNVETEIAMKLQYLRMKWYTVINKSMKYLEGSYRHNTEENEDIVARIVTILESEELPSLSTSMKTKKKGQNNTPPFKNTGAYNKDSNQRSKVQTSGGEYSGRDNEASYYNYGSNQRSNRQTSQGNYSGRNNEDSDNNGSYQRSNRQTSQRNYPGRNNEDSDNNGSYQRSNRQTSQRNYPGRNNEDSDNNGSYQRSNRQTSQRNYPGRNNEDSDNNGSYQRSNRQTSQRNYPGRNNEDSDNNGSYQRSNRQTSQRNYPGRNNEDPDNNGSYQRSNRQTSQRNYPGRNNEDSDNNGSYQRSNRQTSQRNYPGKTYEPSQNCSSKLLAALTMTKGQKSEGESSSKVVKEVMNMTTELKPKAFKLIREFVIKEGSQELINAAFKRNLWPISEQLYQQLTNDLKYTTHIILWFAVKPPRGTLLDLQGYGKFLEFVSGEANLCGQRKNMTKMIRIEWRVKIPLTIDTSKCNFYQSFLDLSNGGELEEHVSHFIIKVWDKEYEKRTGQKRSFY